MTSHSFVIPAARSAARQRFAAALAAFVAASALPAAHAQAPAAQSPVVLDTVRVEATPFKREADQLVQPVDVLEGRELDRRRAGTLGETLENQPGVATSDFGPGVGRPIIRGRGGPRVLVLDNGLSTMDAASVSGDHAVSLDPQHATQVEIIKGPATLIYGSAASGGVVNVVDERLPERVTPGFGGHAQATYGNNANERLGTVDLDYGIGGTQLHADFAGRKTGNFEIPGNSSSDGSGQQGEIPNSGVETTSGDLSLTRAGDWGSLGGSVSLFNTLYGLPGEEEAFIDLEQLRFDAKGVFLKPFSGVDALRLRLGVTDYEHTEFEAADEPGTRFANEEQELRVEAQHAPFGNLAGVIGLQLVNRDFKAIGEEAFIPPVKTQQAGLFVVEELRYGWGQLEGGLRVENVQHEPEAGTSLPNRSITPVSISGGALVTLSPEAHLRLTLSRSERAPAAEELYSFGVHHATETFERGNAALGKETVNNIELGIDQHTGRFTFSASAYYSDVEDYIVDANVDCNADVDSSACNPDGEADFVDEEGAFVANPGPGDDVKRLIDYRQENATFTGVEGEASFRWIDGATKLTSRVFGDLVRGELSDGGNLPRITPPRVGTGLDWVMGPTSVQVEYTRVQRQDQVAALESETAGFNLVSLDVRHDMKLQGSELSLFLRGRNLLDAEARRHTSFVKDVFPLPGQSFFAGASLEF